MSVTFEQIENAFNEFEKAYNYNIPLVLAVTNEPKDLYENKITERDNKTFTGAYDPARGEIILFAANLRDETEITRTLAHEIGGHWSLNTLEPIEKRHLLESIIENREEPSLAATWELVNRDYPELSPLYKAEEVFAFIAEDRFPHKERSQESELDLSPFNSELTINHESIGTLADKIFNGIRNGTREQQIFPKDNQSQFKKDINMADNKDVRALEGAKELVESRKLSLNASYSDDYASRESEHATARKLEDSAYKKLALVDVVKAHAMIDSEREIIINDDQLKHSVYLDAAKHAQYSKESDVTISDKNSTIEHTAETTAKPTITLDDKAKDRLQDMRNADAEIITTMDVATQTVFRVDDTFVKDLENRMAKSQFNELGWRDRDDIDDVMRDVETLARYNLPLADKLWTKYNPDDKDKPVFIDGDDIDIKVTKSTPQASENTIDTDRPEDTKKEFVTPEAIQKKYLQAGNKYHLRDAENALAFEDKGQRIATEHENPEIIKSMIELASAKGWQSIQVKGTDDFKREAWLQASLQGLEVQGYKPKDVDLARLADIKSETPEKSYARNSIINTEDRQVNKTDSLKAVDEIPPTQGLSPQQDTAIKALQSIMRNRGDKEETISMASEIAKERFTTNRVYVGKVIERGTDNYNNDPKAEKSPYVTLQTEAGEKKVWGVDLPRALDEGKVNIGDDIALAYQGGKAVTVKAPQFDEKGNLTGTKEITTNRNAWDAKRLDTMREDAVEKLKEAAKNSKQPVVKVFDRDAQRSSTRSVPEPERARDSERARA